MNVPKQPETDTETDPFIPATRHMDIKSTTMKRHDDERTASCLIENYFPNNKKTTTREWITDGHAGCNNPKRSNQ